MCCSFFFCGAFFFVCGALFFVCGALFFVCGALFFVCGALLFFCGALSLFFLWVPSLFFCGCSLFFFCGCSWCSLFFSVVLSLFFFLWCSLFFCGALFFFSGALSFFSVVLSLFFQWCSLFFFLWCSLSFFFRGTLSFFSMVISLFFVWWCSFFCVVVLLLLCGGAPFFCVVLLFSTKNEMTSQTRSRSSHNFTGPNLHTYGPLPLIRWKCVTIRAMRRAQTEQRCGGCGAGQNRAPPHSPCLFSPSAHEGCLLSCSFANRKDVVSVDMRPPTSIPKTTKRARLRGPTSSGYVRSFLRRTLCKTTPSVLCSFVWGPITMESTDNCGVHSQLATSEQDHDVDGNPPTGFPANSGCRTFQCEPSSPQHACSCTRCSVVAKLVNLTATPASVKRGNGNRRRRNSTTWNKWGGMRVSHTGPWTSLRPHLRSVARPHVTEQLVEVLCTTPHIYEQKTAQTMATSRTCLSTTSTLACT